jgi:hypothetical protein
MNGKKPIRRLKVLFSPEGAAYNSPGQRLGVMQGLWLTPERAAQGHATFLSRPYRARTLLRTDTQGVALGCCKPSLQG